MEALTSPLDDSAFDDFTYRYIIGIDLGTTNSALAYVDLTAQKLSVTFPRRAHNPILRNVPWHRFPNKISWLQDVELELNFK